MGAAVWRRIDDSMELIFSQLLIFVEIAIRMTELPNTFAEFFAGIGLVRMGLERNGWKIQFANDIDPSKRRQYEFHYKDSHSHFHLGDIHELNADSIPPVTLATASFPCTDLSLAGKRVGLGGSK